jgi:hypothetical protein
MPSAKQFPRARNYIHVHNLMDDLGVDMIIDFKDLQA